MIFDEDWGFLEVKIRYPDNERLKVDFNRYPARRLRKGMSWRELVIDSLYDIAVNKLQTISERPRTRDYVDLYAILKTKPWVLRGLVADASRKFGERIDTLHLSKNFLKVVEYKDLPTMLIPFNRKDMDEFYATLARSLKKEVFK